MTDLEKAKDILAQGHSVVAINGETTYISDGKGISPLIQLISNCVSLEGFSVADKIVGKAAAMLFVKLKVKELYAEVLSDAGENILKKHKIQYNFNIKTDKIINRTGDDICPMERCVKDIDDIEQAYQALKIQLEKLKNK